MSSKFKSHWEHIYTTKKIDGVSTEELKQLVNLIEKRTY